MAMTAQSAVSPMYLDDRLPNGYVIVCGADGGEHSFLSPRLGPSVECPQCGRTALSIGLLEEYYERIDRLFGVAGAAVSIEPTSRLSGR